MGARLTGTGIESPAHIHLPLNAMFPFLLPIFLQAAPTPATAAPALPSPTATGAKPAATANRAPSGRVLRLDDAIQVALRAQPLVHEAQAQTAGAVGQAEQGRSGLLPQFSGTALFEQTTSGSLPTSTGGATQIGSSAAPPQSSFGDSLKTAPHGVASASISGTQLLYDFNQTPDKFRAAKRTVESFRASEKTTELTVLLSVRQAFFTARADKALVYVAEETLQNETKHVTQVRGFVAAGTQPEIALATELTNFGNDRVALITAQNNYEIAKAQLNQSMGVVGDTNYDVAEEGLAVIAGEDGPDDRLIDDALKARPEIVAYEKTREANALTVSSLKGGYGPTISAIGQAGVIDPSLQETNNNLAGYWTLGAQLVWPFFQGGLTAGQVHTAEANYNYADAQLEAEKLQVRFQVEQAVLTVRAAKASIDAANEALVNAREQLRLAEGRYQSGVGSIIELGDAQIAATAAAAQVVQADFNLSTARAQLLSALGRP
jgi:outer membrane protein